MLAHNKSKLQLKRLRHLTHPKALRCATTIVGLITLFAKANCGFATETNHAHANGNATQTNSDSPDSFKDRGVRHVKNKEWDLAISDFTRAIQINSKDALAYDYRGCAQVLKGNLSEAVRDFSEVIKLTPTNARVYLNRAGAYYQLDEFDKSLSDVNEALRLNPQDPDAVVTRGNCFCKKGRFAEAVSEYSRAVQINPQSHRARTVLAWLRATCPLASIRNGREAVENATIACELTKRTRWQCLNTLAAAFAECGDFEKALEHQREAMRLPGIPEGDCKKMALALRLYEKKHPNHNWKWETSPPRRMFDLES